LIQRCSKDELAFRAILARSIWLRRISVEHGGDFSHPKKLVHDSGIFFEQVQQAQHVTERNSEDIGQELQERWKAPTAGIFKVNWDVGFHPKLQRMGAGLIVRDDLAGFMQHKARLCHHTRSL
jgi:hypothetical protein